MEPVNIKEWTSEVISSYASLRDRDANENRYREVLVYPTLATYLGYGVGAGNIEIELTNTSQRYDYYLRPCSCAIQVKTFRTFDQGERDIQRYFRARGGEDVLYGVVTDGYRWDIYSKDYSWPRRGPRRETLYRYIILRIVLNQEDDLKILNALLKPEAPQVLVLFGSAATQNRIFRRGENLSFRSVFGDDRVTRYFLSTYLRDETEDRGELYELINRRRITAGQEIVPSPLFCSRLTYFTPRFEITDNGKLKLISLQIALGPEGEAMRLAVRSNDISEGQVFSRFADFFCAVGLDPRRRNMWGLWTCRGRTLSELRDLYSRNS